MIQVIYGKDRFLVLEKRNALIKEIEKQKPNLERFDFHASDHEFQFGQVVEAIQTVSLFGAPRVVFFYVEQEKELSLMDVDHLNSCILNPGDVDIILAFPKKLTQFKTLHASLKKHAKEHVITKANAYNAPAYLQKGLKQYNLQMSPQAQSLFLEYIGEDYSRLQSELEKLALLEVKVDEKIINQMVTKDISRDIFALGNALLDKKRDQAFQIYHSLLTQKNDPLNLAPLMASTLRTIYQIETLSQLGYSENAILESLKISKGQYWVVRNRQSGKVKNILKLLNDLANLDQKTKLGQIDRFVAFELFMLDVMK